MPGSNLREEIIDAERQSLMELLETPSDPDKTPQIIALMDGVMGDAGELASLPMKLWLARLEKQEPKPDGKELLAQMAQVMLISAEQVKWLYIGIHLGKVIGTARQE